MGEKFVAEKRENAKSETTKKRNDRDSKIWIFVSLSKQKKKPRQRRPETLIEIWVKLGNKMKMKKKCSITVATKCEDIILFSRFFVSQIVPLHDLIKSNRNVVLIYLASRDAAISLSLSLICFFEKSLNFLRRCLFLIYTT